MTRIGIDLTSLPGVKGGVAFYLDGLMEGLQRIDAHNDYCLMMRENQQYDLLRGAPNFRAVRIGLSSRPSRLAWEQTGLPRLARDLRLDVLHSPHYTRPLRKLPCASVVGIMDLTFFELPEYHTLLKRTFFRAMIPAAARRADRIITISNSTRNDAIKWLGLDAARIDVTPLAVSPDYRADVPPASIGQVRARYGLPASYVLYVGRLEPRKNLPRLVDAYEKLVRRSPAAPRLVLAGAPGWHWRETEASIRRLGSTVKTLGYVPEVDLPALYAGAVVFLYPSLYEGFGIPVLEALACGVPTITSSRSATAEVAGDAAELVDPHDADDIARALSRLLEDPARREELRRRGLARAAEYSWDRTAALTRDSYLRAVNGRITSH
jgi:glycosyltransferase involved in cell wall biosynthesis